MLPLQWHIYTVDLNPRVGSKPGKQRPCLAIQPSEFSSFGLNSTVILPITTKTSLSSSYPLRVRIAAGICQLSVDSDILVDQILAWDNELFKKDLGILPEAIQDEVKKALKSFLDLD